MKPYLLFSLLLVSAAAQSQCIDIKVRSEVRQTLTDTRGRPALRLVPTEKIGEDEELFYTVSATNTCDRPVEQVVIDNPVPQHMVYVASSAIAPAAIVLFSTDGGFNYAPADVLIPPENYTHIRWVLSKPLQPQAVVFARFRAVVK